MKLIFTISFLALLVGCASAPPVDYAALYKAKMQTWIGYTEEDLISSWGIPEKTYENGGTRKLGYRTSSTSTSSYTTRANWEKWGCTDAYCTTRTTVNNYVYSCETTFTVQGEKIVNVAWEGNNCR